jgi:adenylyltransferase/sulfurtransferase
MAIAPSHGRYARQVLFSKIGTDGQERLSRARVLIVGCGALGSHLAETLVRAGIGRLTLIDRDFVEVSNLQRQALFDERDAAQGLPKAEAARAHLEAINSEVSVTAVVEDFGPRNAARTVAGHDLILDGTDNMETRYVLNDIAVQEGVPWVYGGVLGTAGMVMPVLPGEGPCLTCLFPDPPGPGELPTCDVAGVLGPAVSVVAALEAIEALRVLTGERGLARGLVQFDLWSGDFHRLPIERDPDCPTCRRRAFRYLSAERTNWVTTLCGRNAVQITPPEETTLDLARLKANLEGVGRLRDTGYYLRLAVEGVEMNIFPTGRVILTGTSDPALARTLHARYIGA